MTCSTHVSRRDVLKGSMVAMGAIAAGAMPHGRRRSAVANPLGANERIRVGVIGTGVRGKYLISNLPEPARVVAICDCATSRMAETLEPRGQFAAVLAGFRERDATHCATHQDYRQMIDRANWTRSSSPRLTIITPRQPCWRWTPAWMSTLKSHSP